MIWLGNVLHGDFGTSISLRQNVLTIVLDRLPATLELCLLALLIAVVLGGDTRVHRDALARARRLRPGSTSSTASRFPYLISSGAWRLILVLRRRHGRFSKSPGACRRGSSFHSSPSSI